MSILSRFFKKLQNFNFVILILFFNVLIIFSTIAASIFAYKSDTIMFDAVDLFDEKTQGAISLGEKRNKLMLFFQEFDFFNSQFLNFDDVTGLPILDIKIDKKNIDYINNVIARSMDQSKNVYSLGPFISIYDNDFEDDTKSKLVFEGKEYDIKIKLHGVAEENWINPKKSFSIKTAKDNLVDNTRRFKLIIFEEQSIQTLFSYYIANFLEFMTVKSDIVKLRFNGVDQGLYLLEEALSKELLEKNGLSGFDVIKALDEWTHQYKTGHITLFTHEVSNQQLNNYSGRDVGQLVLFKRLMEADNYKEIRDLIDIDRFARHEAMRILFGSDQGIAGDNLKLLFDTSSGKFSPYFRVEGYLLDLPSSDLSNTFDHGLNDWFEMDYKIKIFPIVNRNDEFRALRNKYLFSLLSSREDLEEIYEGFFSKYSPLVTYDRTNNYPSRWYVNKMRVSKEALSNNFDYIDSYLNYSKVFTTLMQISEGELILEIIPDSNSIISIDTLLINGIDPDSYVEIQDLSEDKSNLIKTTIREYFSDRYFSLSLDENLEVKKNIYKFKILTNQKSVSDFSVSYVNAITGSKVLQKETYSKFVRIPSKEFPSADLTNNSNLASLINKYDGILASSSEIRFLKGDYLITKDILVPVNYNLTLDSGVNIEISKGVSFVSRGSLFIKGTSSSPVVITNNAEGPYGVFGSVGNNKTLVSISYLDISGGSEDIFLGMYLSGGLSIYSHDEVIIRNSFIHHHHADDGLNVKFANVIIEDNVFKDNFADQVDLDNCVGKVSYNTFLNKSSVDDLETNEAPNGDGLDLSGSKLLVMNNKFINFQDKGMSVGEETFVNISFNSFSSNRSAVTLKDHSVGYFYSNEYYNNEINLEMYQKKPIFKHPIAYNLNEVYLDSKIKKTISSRYYKLQNTNYRKEEFSQMMSSLDSLNNPNFQKGMGQNWNEYQ